MLSLTNNSALTFNEIFNLIVSSFMIKSILFDRFTINLFKCAKKLKSATGLSKNQNLRNITTKFK